MLKSFSQCFFLPESFRRSWLLLKFLHCTDLILLCLNLGPKLSEFENFSSDHFTGNQQRQTSVLIH